MSEEEMKNEIVRLVREKLGVVVNFITTSTVTGEVKARMYSRLWAIDEVYLVGSSLEDLYDKALAL